MSNSEPNINALPNRQIYSNFPSTPPPQRGKGKSCSPERACSSNLTILSFRGREFRIPCGISSFKNCFMCRTYDFSRTKTGKQDGSQSYNDELMLKKLYILFFVCMGVLGYWIWFTELGKTTAGDYFKPPEKTLTAEQTATESNFFIQKNAKENLSTAVQVLEPDPPINLNFTLDGRKKVDFIVSASNDNQKPEKVPDKFKKPRYWEKKLSKFSGNLKNNLGQRVKKLKTKSNKTKVNTTQNPLHGGLSNNKTSNMSVEKHGPNDII